MPWARTANRFTLHELFWSPARPTLSSRRADCQSALREKEGSLSGVERGQTLLFPNRSARHSDCRLKYQLCARQNPPSITTDPRTTDAMLSSFLRTITASLALLGLAATSSFAQAPP